MNKAASRPLVTEHIDASALWPSVAAILLGAFLLFGVGFAQPNLLHNAAHDTRHSAVFPCH